MRLALLFVVACSTTAPPPCTPATAIPADLFTVDPPVDDDGVICSAADGLMVVRHPTLNPHTVRDRYHTHYANHDWSVEDRDGVLHLKGPKGTATIRLLPDAEGTRVELRVP